MVIKGTVHNGHIKIEDSALPEGTHVLITPICSPDLEGSRETDLLALKSEINRIAALPCQNACGDNFSGADHDKILYGS